MTARVFAVIGAASVLALTIACSPAGADGSGGNDIVIPPSTATRVEVATVRPSTARVELMLPGEIEGARDAVLASALGGLVERVRVDNGDVVSRGQVLVQVDSEIYAAQRDQAQAQRDLAASDLERIRAIGDLATAQQIQQAETQLAVAEATLRSASAQLARAVVRAPFAGTVSDVAVESGEFAGMGAPLLRVVQLDPVRVTLSVPDRDRVALAAGMEVAVTTNASSGVLPGTITHVSPAADPRTRAFPVEVTVDNPDGALLPGMIANVSTVRTVGSDSVVIPQDWIVTTLTGQGVFIDRDNVAEWRPVQLGAIARDQVVVTGGISAGDRVVMTGHRELAQGDELLVVREGICCEAGRPVWEQEG